MKYVLSMITLVHTTDLALLKKRVDNLDFGKPIDAEAILGKGNQKVEETEDEGATVVTYLRIDVDRGVRPARSHYEMEHDRDTPTGGRRL